MRLRLRARSLIRFDQSFDETLNTDCADGPCMDYRQYDFTFADLAAPGHRSRPLNHSTGAELRPNLKELNEMAVVTTHTSAKGWSPDVQGFAPSQIMPTALIITATSQAGFVEGDEPSVRVPAIKLDDAIGYVREGADIDEDDPDLAELVIHTAKIAELIKVSREQLAQPNALDTITAAIRRAMIARADYALLQTPAPVAPAVWPPAGLLAHATEAGDIVDNLDALVDVVADIEGLPGGIATHIIASPHAYAAVRRMKTATGSNVSLVGAGVEAGVKTLLDVPVLTTSAMPSNKIIVIDKNQILSAYGEVILARSDDYYFGSDNVALRATFRFGVGYIEPRAIQVLTIDED